MAKGLATQLARSGRYGRCAVEPTVAEEERGVETGAGRDPFEEAWVDVSGKALDPKLVKKAREESMAGFMNREVY